jgi:nucleoside-diphosphate-sugar epimerase
MIRWIIHEKLGTAAYGEHATKEDTVEVDARTLVDKRGNSPAALLEKIDEGARGLTAGRKVVVVCDFGVSRSNTIAAGILARWKNLDIDQAVAEVVSLTGESSIKLDMVETLRSAFGHKPSANKRDNILITGGRGFIGAALAKRLASHSRVSAPTRTELDLLGPTISLDRYCRQNEIGTIVHLAYPRIYTNNDAMGESLRMLRNVMDACKANGLHLMLPSSWVVFSGYRASGMIADPGTAPRPRGVYGETKFLEEALVRSAVDNGELTATIIRLSPVFGAESLRPRIIRFARQYLLEGRTIVTHRYRNGLPRLQLLFVDDAVSGIAAVVERGKAPIYQLGGTAAHEPREIINAVAKLLNREATIEETAIEDYVANVFLDCRSAEREFDWRPATDLETGLRHTLRGIEESA